MSTTITRGETVLAPDAVTAIRTERPSRNLVHDIIGQPSAATLRPAGLRTGTLELAYHGEGAEAASEVAETAHALGGVFTIVSPDRPTLAFSYVTSDGGRIARELRAETGVWALRIDFQEVTR